MTPEVHEKSCHIVAQPVAPRATAVPFRGAASANPLVTQVLSRLYNKAGRKNALYPLIFLGETPLQPWLRMVCALRSPGRAKQITARPLPVGGRSFASPCGWVFGTVAAVFLLAAPAPAEGWTNTSKTTGWSSADRFKAETPTTSGRSATVAFDTFLKSLKGGELDKLRALISRAESPRLGYDSVQVRARVKPPETPTQMTLGGIFTWIKATPGQQHAIGRYQVIPVTLAYVSKELGFTHATPFNRHTQDLIATFLIREAGYKDFRTGRLSRTMFMDNLARVWAGLPLRNGRSAYTGIAGNKATISRAQYDRAMGSIFPIRRVGG